MKQFNPKDTVIESKTALAMVEQQRKRGHQYGKYVGLDVHKDSRAMVKCGVLELLSNVPFNPDSIFKFYSYIFV